MTASVALTPLLGEHPPILPVGPYSPPGTVIGKAAVLLAMLAAILVAVWTARAADDGRSWVVLPLLLMTALMTAWHAYFKDSDPHLVDWQHETYYDILNHRGEAPHPFRPLPYGFVRSLEHITGDWQFSCLAYRGFFTWWFVWCCYRFARLWHPPKRALWTLLPVVLLYPLSVAYYWGQLTDPLNHALFVLALICVVQDRWLLLAATIALAVPAKETVLLVVPTYFVCTYCSGQRVIESGAKTAVVGAAAMLAFLAVRLPLGWRPGHEDINGVSGLMIGTNLGIGQPIAYSSEPLWVNYLHPAVFVLPFVPFLVWGWKRIDIRLKAICLTLTPLVLLSNLCFGWLYESRNYMPLLSPLATAALFAFAPVERLGKTRTTTGCSVTRSM